MMFSTLLLPPQSVSRPDPWRWTGLALLGLILALLLPTSPAAAEGTSLRLTEPVAPGATLGQIAANDAGLSARLEALTADAAKDGSVRVAVKTAVAFAPENLLGPSERTLQRKDIAAAAAALRKALPQAQDFRALEDMPYVMLELDAAGLAQLVATPGLVRISPESGFNWLRDFVQLRVAHMSAATGPTAGQAPDAPQISQRIVGGTMASAGTHPFQVGLLYKALPDNWDAQFCGGTLIAERFVVTAAHCSDTVTNPLAQVEVLVGTQKLDGSGTRVGVNRITIHPRWRSATNDYDVAVWELATPVTGIAFATLAGTQPTVAGTPLRVTGWGRLREIATIAADYPLDLMQVDVPFVPTARRACGLQRKVTARMICAGEAGKDSCKGDSGGPLTINRGAGFTELVGIVSFGNGCARAGYPGVYTNVAEGRVNSFIRDIALAPPRIITVAASAVSVNEGSRRVTVTVQRTNTSGTARVRYTTAAGTALARSDFRARTGTVSFKKGQATASFAITIVNDRVKESDESFTVSLFQPAALWSIGSAAATTVTITDND